MSLQLAAQHLASRGRGGDSVLVHMSPEEVHALQKLAEAHGTSLTINPETGQPEAFSLKSLIPMIAGLALGPAGLGVTLGGLSSAATAGLLTGGFEALRTGDLMKGVTAGLGAYGGASLSGTLAESGASSLGAGEVGTKALESAGYTPELAAQTPLSEAAELTKGATSQVPMADKLTAGISRAAENPIQFAKENWKPLAAAAVPTLTEMPEPVEPLKQKGYYRGSSFDPISGEYTYYEPIPLNAAGGGIMSAAELMYSNDPVIRMADGGSANPAPGSEQYVQNVKNWFEANPTASAADVQSAIQQYNLNPADVKSAMQQAGLSGAAQYAAFNKDIGSAANVAETQGGLGGLSSNINYWMQQNPGASLNDVRNEMNRWQLSDADIIRATGKRPEELYTGPVTGVVNPAEGVGGNTSAVVNPNGTITQVALPPAVTGGKPTGTIQNIKDIYTEGGGSLGYQPYVPKTYEEFEQKFTNTGGSKAAYDYLMGKTPYSPTPVTATGEVMKPYAESVLGVPGKVENKRYIFNPDTRTYDLNPNFKPFVFDPQAPGLTTRGMSANEVKDYLTSNPSMTDSAVYQWATKNKVSPEAIALALNKSVSEIQKKFDAFKSGESGTTATGDTQDRSDLYSKGKVPTRDPGAGNNWVWDDSSSMWKAVPYTTGAHGGIMDAMSAGGHAQYNLGDYSDGGRLLRGPGDGVSDDIPATIAGKRPARLADGEFVVPARIVSELGNGSTEAGARKLYAMMDRIQANRQKTVGKGKVAVNSRADKHLPA